MSDPTLDVDALRRAGAYDSREAVLEDALRALLHRRPELRTEIAIEQY